MMGEYDAGYENCIDAMVRQMEDMQYRIDCLHAENAELKRLCRDMHVELVACEENGYVCGGHKFDERAEKLVVKS